MGLLWCLHQYTLERRICFCAELLDKDQKSSSIFWAEQTTSGSRCVFVPTHKRIGLKWTFQEFCWCWTWRHVPKSIESFNDWQVKSWAVRRSISKILHWIDFLALEWTKKVMAEINRFLSSGCSDLLLAAAPPKTPLCTRHGFDWQLDLH